MENEILETEVLPVENTALTKVIAESGLQLNEAETIKQSYLPYFNQIAEIKEQAKKINFENPTELDEKIARELRLKTVKIRTGSEQVKDERKRIHTLKANVEQSAWNLIKTTCQLDEETFLQVEKKREIAEKARKEELKKERTALLADYSDFINPEYVDLGGMTDEAFKSLLNGVKLQLEAKIEADRKAEAERIAAEKAEAERLEAQRLENERLKAEAAAKEKELEAERAKAEKERLAQQAILEAERKKADELLANQRKQAEAEAKKQAEILAKEKAAKEKLEAELKAKQQAEAEAKRKEEERVAAEAKAKAEAEKKAAKAPDKAKMKSIISEIKMNAVELKSEESKAVYNVIQQKFEAFKAWAEQQIESL